MQSFETLTSRVARLLHKDVDTDQIIPASYLKGTTREGLGKGLFANWRFDEEGRERPDFELLLPEAVGARILLTGDNFGCGSSREHAVWALQDFGLRVVISTRFADIFRSNAGRNGLVTAEVAPADHQRLVQRLEADPARELTVDLATREVVPSGDAPMPFDIDPFARLCLLEGLDPLSYLLAGMPAIEEYERQRESSAGTKGG